MKLDESHPDYFTDDAAVNEATESSAEDTRKITFGEPSTMSGATGGGEEPEARRCGRWRKVVAWVIAAAVAMLAVTVYFRYFNPYVSDGQMKCYVINVEKRGLVFKTYEADVVSEAAVSDTLRLYSREESLSIEDEGLARRLQSMQGTGRAVTLRYKTYWATVPWRGASKSVVTGIEQ